MSDFFDFVTPNGRTVIRKSDISRVTLMGRTLTVYCSTAIISIEEVDLEFAKKVMDSLMQNEQQPTPRTD